MKLVESLAADYWIENTNKIYEEDLHVSTPVMEAYEAGFRKGLQLAHKEVQGGFACCIPNLADEDDGNGKSLYEQCVESKAEFDFKNGYYYKVMKFLRLVK